MSAIDIRSPTALAFAGSAVLGVAIIAAWVIARAARHVERCRVASSL
ncbi:MAG TPA: hypothetical protein VGG78_04900 [Gemmatimonadaceae bacterium]|jgi:uncharacterized membrane protein